MPRNGFTLVELLVVLVILGLAAGAVALTLPTGDDRVRGEATAFAGKVAALRDRAILEGRPAGLWVQPSGYGFEVREEGAWVPLETAPFAAAVNWRSGVVAQTGGSPRIQLRFDNVGMPSTPARIDLTDGENNAAVEIAANGDVKAL
ncbi:GspH/FimT family protein [Sphingomicrobium marinum]|uniref:GspH/FimT family protein n=1 Tax=Sphingomicrobium marinum TaxID=1227950 RepID=UPI00223FD629|nr:GspH/FimT family protein [Sphingomicrobium marinum]